MYHTDLQYGQARQEQLLEAAKVPETISTADSAKQSIQNRILLTIGEALIESGYALRQQVGAHTYRRMAHSSK